MFSLIREGARIPRSIILLSLVLFVGVAEARAMVPSPQQVLDQAAKGKPQYLDVTTAVRDWAGKASPISKVFPYLEILDRLDPIARRYGLSARPFADVLTDVSAKGIRLDDQSAVLDAFWQWAESDARDQMLRRQPRYLAALATKVRLLQWETVEVRVMDRLLKSDADVDSGDALIRLQQLTIRKLLHLEEGLLPAEMTALIHDARHEPVLKELASYLRAQSLRLRDPRQLVHILSWSRLAHAQMQPLSDLIDPETLALPGRAVVEALSKLLSWGSPLGNETADGLVKVLAPEQVADLSDRLTRMFASRPVPAGQLDFVWKLLPPLADKLTAMGLDARYRAFMGFAGSIGLQRLAGQRDMEGSYEINSDGYPGGLTLHGYGNSRYLLGLQLRYPSGSGSIPVSTSFFEVTYNLKSGKLEARYALSTSTLPEPSFTRRPGAWPNPPPPPRPPLLPGEPIPADTVNYYMELTPSVVDGKNCLEGKYTTGKGFHSISGCQVSKVEKLVPAQAIPLPLGRYRGTASGRSVEMIVTEAGGELSGSLRFMEADIVIDFLVEAYQPEHAALFMTSDVLPSGGFVQVRGQFLQGGKVFQGAYYVAGEGKRFDLRLAKID